MRFFPQQLQEKHKRNQSQSETCVVIRGLLSLKHKLQPYVLDFPCSKSQTIML